MARFGWLSRFSLSLALLALAPGSGAPAQPVDAAPPPVASSGLAGARLPFVQNTGQFADGARFQLRTGAGTLWLGGDAIWLTVAGAPPPAAALAGREGMGDQSTSRYRTAAERGLPAKPAGARAVALRFSFPGANAGVRLEPFERLSAAVHYYIGRSPASWRPNAPVWGGVRYRDLYPGVDLEITTEAGEWVWRLVARDQAGVPGANRALTGRLLAAGSPLGSAIRLRVEGADAVALEEVAGSGRPSAARLTTAAGEIRIPLLQVNRAGQGSLPLATGTRPTVGGNEIRQPFSTGLPAAVTPRSNSAALLLGTFLGGSGGDQIEDLALDATGAIYVTGATSSSGFPTTPGAYDPSLSGTYDVFVTKLNPDGAGLVYSTFLGGSYQSATYFEDLARAIALDQQGAAYLTGWTMSSDFPTTAGAFDTSFNGDPVCGGVSPDRPCSDGFVAKLDSTGRLAYATFLGGSGTTAPDGLRISGDDQGEAIAVDETGLVYVAGWTRSEDFPTTPGAYKRVFADVEVGLNDDVFVAKLNLAGQGAADLLYSTFVGTGFTDRAYAMAIDRSGAVYVTGSTGGGFPTTPGAHDSTFGGVLYTFDRDAFVFKLNPAGHETSDLVYSTYLGGDKPGAEYGYGIALGPDGAVYVTGSTLVSDFPTTSGAFDTGFNSAMTAFVSKLNLAGAGRGDLAYSTFLGGGLDEGRDIAVDAGGTVYVTGYTVATAFPTTPDAFDTTFHGYPDAFLARLQLLGSGAADLQYSTFLGGSSPDGGEGIALGSDGTVYVAGYTYSSNFPTTAGGYDTTFGGGTCSNQVCSDGFVVKLTTTTYSVSGQVIGATGTGIAGLKIATNTGQSATTDATGSYAFAGLPAGTYTLAPATAGYFWWPVTRTVAVPPAATGQDFTVENVRLTSSQLGSRAVGFGTPITYVISIIWPQSRSLTLYDALPPNTSLLGTPDAPAGVGHDAVAKAISGTISMAAGVTTTVSFSVRVDVTGTITSSSAFVNRACVRLSGTSLASCTWSNDAVNFTYVWPMHLPYVARQSSAP